MSPTRITGQGPPGRSHRDAQRAGDHPFGQLVRMLAHLRNAARKLAHDEAKMAHNKVKISPQLDRKMSNNERSGRKSNINIPITFNGSRSVDEKTVMKIVEQAMQEVLRNLDD